MFKYIFSSLSHHQNLRRLYTNSPKIPLSNLGSHIIEENTKTLTSGGTWIGKIIHKGTHKVVTIDKKGKICDLSSAGIWSVAALLQHKNPVQIVKEALHKASVLPEDIKSILQNSIIKPNSETNSQNVKFISPHDLSSMKAAGVVFVKSLLERVVEEQAKGDPERAHNIRGELSKVIGKQLDQVKPGTEESIQLLKILTEVKGVSRHYLEVGLGPDAELFTKAQPMSSIGFGSQLGINRDSSWNNPEPEIVVVVNKFGEIVGSTLGNDVNLRDWEGRSALLLGRAKDVNGSCVIGPMIRLFDETFSLFDVRNAVVTLSIFGEDGFFSEDFSSMNEIGRDVTELVAQAFKTHQYPDGLFLMTGTMFAPVEDRDPVKAPGRGFTHKLGDHVVISTPYLSKLYNTVNYCDAIPQWSFGSVSFINQLLNNRS